MEGGEMSLGVRERAPGRVEWRRAPAASGSSVRNIFPAHGIRVDVGVLVSLLKWCMSVVCESVVRAIMAEELLVVLSRSENSGLGFSLLGQPGLPPIIYDIVEDSPAAESGEVGPAPAHPSAANTCSRPGVGLTNFAPKIIPY